MTMSFVLCAATCCGTWSAVPVDFFRGGLFAGLPVCGRVGRLPGRLLRVVVVRSTCITMHRVWIVACIHSRVCLCDCVAGGGCLLMLRTRSPDRMSARRAGDGSVTVFTTMYPLLSCPCQLRATGHFRPAGLGRPPGGAVLFWWSWSLWGACNLLPISVPPLVVLVGLPRPRCVRPVRGVVTVPHCPW